MSFYRKSDFAKLCGVTTGNLANDARRGVVKYTGKFVDASLAINKEYMKRREDVLKKKGQKLDKSVKPLPKSAIPKDDLQDTQAQGSRQLELKLAKDAEDLRKKKIDADIAQLNYEKLVGSSIPTEMVMEVIALLGQSIITSYTNGSKALLDEIGHSKKLPRKERARLKGKLTEIINASHSEAITQAKANVKNIIKQYNTGKS